MNDLLSANLILERMIRGHLPVTRYSVSAVGSVTVAVPDPNQTRLYHLGQQSHTGEWKEISSFSVEKVRYWDLAAVGDAFVVATADDIYYFSGGQKSRPLAGRRDSHVGVSITASGESFVAASADMLMSSYSVTLVSAAGGTQWTLDLPLTLTSVQISPDGSLIAAGSEEGTLCLIGSDRQVAWEFDAGEPISTVYLPSSDGTVIFGTKSGRVAAVRDAGNLWVVEGDGSVTACAGTSDGKMIAVARDGADNTHTVECITEDGKFLLGHSAPAAVTSVACSDDGRYLALSRRDGTLQVIEVEARSNRAAEAQQAFSIYESALLMASRGEFAEAVSALIRALELNPTDTRAALELAETAQSLVHDLLRLAEEAFLTGAYAAGARRLEAAWQNCILAPDMATEVLSARRMATGRMLERAQDLADKDVIDDALEVLEAIISLDPANIEARELLGRLQRQVSERVVSEAEDALRSGHPGEAVRLLEEAHDRYPSEIIEEKLRHARAQGALAEGLALYREQKFSRALFHFRKALSLEPGNADARKHIEYAENLSEDSTLHDRFSRLE